MVGPQLPGCKAVPARRSSRCGQMQFSLSLESSERDHLLMLCVCVRVGQLTGCPVWSG